MFRAASGDGRRNRPSVTQIAVKKLSARVTARLAIGKTPLSREFADTIR